MRELADGATGPRIIREPHGPKQARSSRILCTITFHFVAARIGFLAEVLRSLSQYQVASLDVVIVTNTGRQEELGVLRRLCREALAGHTGSVRSFAGLSHPWHLTWCHKTILAEEFAGRRDRYTHFIYLEDDIRLSFVNFCYFLTYREALRGFGLLPAFIRVEFSASFAGFVASDAFWPVYVPVQSHVLLDDLVFLNMPNPYNPCFILDAELASEYVLSPSFDREGSTAVCPWGVRERAAMGLCLENVPAPFQSRYVVPVSRQSNCAPGFAQVSHLANNYASNPRSALGKVRMDTLFSGATELTSDGGWWPTASAVCRTDLADTHPGAHALAPRCQPDVVAGAANPDLEKAGGQFPRGSLERYYLVTHHDTFAFVDTHLKLVRHAPFGVAPLNLVIEVAERRGRLVLKERASKQERRLSLASASGEIASQSVGADSDYDVVTFSDGRIGLAAGGHYLRADLDGVVRNDATWCRDWERYVLVREDTLDGLALLRRYSWLSHADRRIVSLAVQPVDFGRDRPAESSALAATLAAGAIDLRRELVFGPARLCLAGKQAAFLPDDTRPDRDDPPAVGSSRVDLQACKLEYSIVSPK